ncbi:MAG TPA: AraC family transcriptional regulator [Polyangiales bacterium]|nr:AraC family transcriptional regulator [Polyangiales bacterium]
MLSIVLVHSLLEHVERAGVSRDLLLTAAEFDSARLEDKDARITLAEYDRLWEVALDATGDDALGLHAAEHVSATTYSLLAHLVERAATFREGIEGTLRFHRLVADRPTLELIEDGSTATLRCKVEDGAPRCRRARAEHVMTSFYRWVRFFSPSAPVLRASFDHAAPSYRAEYTRIFEGAEHFDEPYVGIVFDRNLLDASTLHKDEELHNALAAEAKLRVARIAGRETYADRVLEVLMRGGAAQRLEMSSVARTLGLSPRSLRRRLEAEGASYNAIAENALTTFAKRLLAVEERTIQETAHEMGFSDASAFNRAFKRWTGTTPSSYRLACAAASAASSRKSATGNRI